MTTEQEIFDKAVQHLLTQKDRSYDRERAICMYRGPNGLMCGAGPFIKDEAYTDRMEGKPIGVVVHRWPEAFNVDLTNDRIRAMLTHIQSIHDNVPIPHWRQRLEDMADTFGLTFNPPVAA